MSVFALGLILVETVEREDRRIRGRDGKTELRRAML